jgi:hypothetical protein
MDTARFRAFAVDGHANRANSKRIPSQVDIVTRGFHRSVCPLRCRVFRFVLPHVSPWGSVSRRSQKMILPARIQALPCHMPTSPVRCFPFPSRQ